MPRVMEIATPLGDDVLLFHGMHAREELSRLGEYQLDLLSPQGRHQPRRHPRQERHGQAGAARRQRRGTSTATSRASRRAACYGRYHRYTAVVRPWLWFLTRTADCRIFQDMTVPDIVKAVFADHATADFKFELTGDLPQVDLLRAVPRDRLQLRQPADGAGGHLLLLPPHRRPRHAGADRLRRASTRRLPGTRRSRSSRPDQLVRPELEHISSWDFDARDPAGRLRARRLRLRAAERRAQDQEGAARAATRPATTRSTTIPGDYVQKPDGEQYARRADRRARRAVRDRRTRPPTRRASASGRCSRSRTARAPTRTASTWSSRASYDLRVQRLRRRCREGGGTRLPLHASPRCRARSSSGRGG